MVSTSRLPKYVCLFNSASKPILNAYIPLLDKAVAGLVVSMHSHFNQIFIYDTYFIEMGMPSMYCLVMNTFCAFQTDTG